MSACRKITASQSGDSQAVQAAQAAQVAAAQAAGLPTLDACQNGRDDVCSKGTGYQLCNTIWDVSIQIKLRWWRLISLLHINAT